ncbi:MAG TPA: thiolase domain-containing protein [Candidatus Thermoplasmatota archaeon]|nr:thiolase domain-containing protein [Candidatus Thermoplasmatota archaeon]
MRDVAILGVGVTKFGELWERSFRQLITEAGLAAVKDAKIPGDKIEAMYVGSMSAGRLIGQEHIGPLVVDEAGLAATNIPATRIEAADASGGVALRQAYMAIASGAHDVVVVGGVEKMMDVIDQEATNTLATVADQEWEAFFGATFPSLYAMMARSHMQAYGTTREQLAAVAVKNHEHGSMNPVAAYGNKITVDTVLSSPMVADPLRLFDSASTGDGAAALVLTSVDVARRHNDGRPIVKIAGSGQASDTFALHDRASFTELAATKVAAARAYKQAGKTARDIQVAEVHDSFTIGEILAIEDLGFFKKGEGGPATEKGRTTVKGEKPVNTSGGLKARGHPPGATGIAQAAEIVWQLRGECGARQVPNARVGLAHNVGGSGGTAVVHVLEAI